MIGDLLREARERKRLTMSSVAESVGVTAGYISSLEKNRVEPSLALLRRLAEALGIPAFLLFREERAENAIVVRKGERPKVRFLNLPCVCEVASPLLWNGISPPDMEVIQVDAPPGFKVGARDISPESDECVYVLKGSLSYEDGGAVAGLSKGAGVYIPRMTGFHLSNDSDEEASFIWIAKPPSAIRPFKAKGGKGRVDMPQLSGDSRLKLIGERIKDLRRRQGLGLNALAKMIGVSAAYVSQIENNLAEPSLPVLRGVAKALGVELVLLFAGDVPADALITRAETRPELMIPDGSARFQLLMPFLAAGRRKPDMSVVIASLAPGMSDSPDFVTHGYSELCIALEGSMEYRTDSGSYVLAEGDSLYLRENVRHMVYNPGNSQASILAVFGNVFNRIPGFKEDGDGSGSNGPDGVFG
jgi:transcriptional regulator with XRE-family HTH domain